MDLLRRQVGGAAGHRHFQHFHAVGRGKFVAGRQRRFAKGAIVVEKGDFGLATAALGLPVLQRPAQTDDHLIGVGGADQKVVGCVGHDDQVGRVRSRYCEYNCSALGTL